MATYLLFPMVVVLLTCCNVRHEFQRRRLTNNPRKEEENAHPAMGVASLGLNGFIAV